MKRAASNLTLPAFEHAPHLAELTARGITGLEVAPYHTFRSSGEGINAGEVKAYRRQAEIAGLEVIGLHALSRRPLDVSQLAVGSYKGRAMAHLIDFSQICRDLGGRTLIIEARRRGGDLSEKAAWIVFRDFMEELLPQIEHHGTVFCLAPIAAGESDFCLTARECYMLTNAIDHSSFGIHLGTRGLGAEGRINHQLFAAARGRVELVHVDEPNRERLGSTGLIDHADFRRHLVAATYKGWLSVVQGEGGDAERLAMIASGLDFFDRTYFPYDLDEELDGPDARFPFKHSVAHSV